MYFTFNAVLINENALKSSLNVHTVKVVYSLKISNVSIID